MNRSEKRRLAKYGTVNGPVETLTNDDVIYYYSLAFAGALYSECDMNGDEIAKVFKKAYFTADCLKSRHISLADLETMCEEELGIEFIRKIKRR